MAGARGRRKYPLTIGELFPDGDIVGQWVFAVTELADDLVYVLPSLTDALGARDFRAMLFYQRLLVMHIYEAGALVRATRRDAELARFAGPLLHLRGLVDLRAAYKRRRGSSHVDDLYKQIRNRTAHYREVGRPDLKDALWNHSGAPAELEISEINGRDIPRYHWVTVIRMSELMGGLSAPDILKTLEERTQTATAIGSTWMMISSLALAQHAYRLGIDFERLGTFARKPEG